MLARSHSAPAAMIAVSRFVQGKSSLRGITHSWVCNNSRGLDLDHSLHKLDAAYTYTSNSGVPSSEYVGLDGSHPLPSLRVMGIIDTGGSRKCKTLLVMTTSSAATFEMG